MAYPISRISYKCWFPKTPIISGTNYLQIHNIGNSPCCIYNRHLTKMQRQTSSDAKATDLPGSMWPSEPPSASSGSSGGRSGESRLAGMPSSRRFDFWNRFDESVLCRNKQTKFNGGQS
jgi:hypothetical protein